MGQQVADADIAARRFGRCPGGDTLIPERRDVLRDRIRQQELAFFVQHHHGDALGICLGCGGVGAHGLPALHILEPDCVHVDDLPLTRDERDDARDLAPVHECLHAAVHPFEPFARDTDARRPCRRQVLGRRPSSEEHKQNQRMCASFHDTSPRWHVLDVSGPISRVSEFATKARTHEKDWVPGQHSSKRRQGHGGYVQIAQSADASCSTAGDDPLTSLISMEYRPAVKPPSKTPSKTPKGDPWLGRVPRVLPRP